MHTSSGISHKLSFLRLFCWCSREYPIFWEWVECNLVLFFRCCLPLSSWDLSSNFAAWDCADEEFWLVFFTSDGPLFSRTLRDVAGSEGVAAVCSGFCAPSVFRGGNCNGLLANTGLSFHWKQTPFPPSTPDNTFRLFNTAPVAIFPCLAPKFREGSSDLFSFAPWFLPLAVGNRYLLSMSYHSNTFLSWSDSRSLNVYRLSKTSSVGISDIDSKTSSHLLSNSSVFFHHEEQQRAFGVVWYCVVSASHSKIVVDHEGDLFSS